ncbi:hypothetical protein C4N9_20740 [Pararhodobacter marinus]|uniref:Uncharacterized protein n=1 Tax=Pararhodobacter marinus TaxID=2184063 RepID=A0A2U2C4C2_9RHOB|nr:hypothetical protein [Pararhodobacter marinus]PWE26691.1 hypothetical protein C4N9_20740 [Pararhodobacter marinus]
MSLIDDIKADRDRRILPGQWRVLEGTRNLQIFSERHWIAIIKCESCPAFEESTARRIARVPDLEAALLAAGELAEMLDNASSPWVWGSGQDIDWRHKRDAALAAFRRAIGEAG